MKKLIILLILVFLIGCRPITVDDANKALAGRAIEYSGGADLIIQRVSLCKSDEICRIKYSECINEDCPLIPKGNARVECYERCLEVAEEFS
jgi:hypothetical protein